jgi:hypothetical protein
MFPGAARAAEHWSSYLSLSGILVPNLPSNIVSRRAILNASLHPIATWYILAWVYRLQEETAKRQRRDNEETTV